MVIYSGFSMYLEVILKCDGSAHGKPMEQLIAS